MAVNVVHGQLRRRFMTAEKAREVEILMGKRAFDIFVDSGITGVTPGKVTPHDRMEWIFGRSVV